MIVHTATVNARDGNGYHNDDDRIKSHWLNGMPGLNHLVPDPIIHLLDDHGSRPEPEAEGNSEEQWIRFTDLS